RHASTASEKKDKVIVHPLEEVLYQENAYQELVGEFKKELTCFAQENFYVYKKGERFFYSTRPDQPFLGLRCYGESEPKENVKNICSDISDAVNYLFDEIETGGAKDIYELMTTSSFKELLKNERNFSFWKKNLNNLCKNFCDKYKGISEILSKENLT